jgi:hypothetical protein
LTDQATFTWFDLCDKTPVPSTCSTTTEINNQASSSTTVKPYTPTITTQLSASGIGVGDTVHDTAKITFDATPPTVTGTVTYKLYTDSACEHLSTTPSLNQTVSYSGGTVPDSMPVTFPAVGNFWFQATFSGDPPDAVSGPVSSPCTSEPLTVEDAKISITPNGVNPIGATHTFTVTVQGTTQNDANFHNVSGAVVNFTIAAGGVGTLTPASCTTGANGTCTITDNSASAGTDVVTACTDVSINSVTLHRCTDGTHGSSGPATKQWVGASITIAPSATNEVGKPHTFTVTLLKNLGSGPVAAAGEHVSVTLTDANGASHGAPTGSCTTSGANTDVNGQCTITFSSSSAGTVTGHATSTLNVNGTSVTVQTDGQGGNSKDAVKTYVDAKISILPPNATNAIGTPHTFTVSVQADNGSGTGFQPVNGAVVTGSIAAGGVGTLSPATCTTDATGTCNLVDTSTKAGKDTVSATTTISVGGVSLTRATDTTHGSTGPAIKNWVAAKITIAPSATNEVGKPHTFTVTVSADTGSGFQPVQGAHVDVTLTPANGATPGAPSGTCTNAGGNTNASGQCLITFSSPTAGTVTGHAKASLTVGGLPVTVETNGLGGSSNDAVKTYVDANIQITPANATNPTGTTHVLTGHVNFNDGSGAFANAPDNTTITFTILSGSVGSFVGGINTCKTSGGSGSCNVTITSATAGTTTVKAAVDITVGGVALHRETGDGKAGDSVNAVKMWLGVSVVTQVLDVNNKDVTNGAVPVSSVVHDKVTVSATPAGAPQPTGDVIFTLYKSLTCNQDAGTVGTWTKTLVGGVANTDPVGPLDAGSYGFQAVYQGDSNYPNKTTGACEPFTVTPITVGPCTLGYPDASNPPRSQVAFNESTVLVSAGLFGTGSQEHVGVFYTDEHALTLGSGASVTPYPGSPPNGGQSNPNVGDTTAVDTAGRPLFPALFATDITSNANSRTGDWQQQSDNTNAKAPTKLFGSWKGVTGSGSSINTGNDPAQNPNWQLGTGADPPPNVTTQGYTSEVVWSVAQLGLTPGRAYRLQVMVHDGDQNKTGGDVGEACVNVVIPPGTIHDANIQITPQTATNPVTTTHTVTAHVNVNPGSGFVNASDGTTIKFTIVSGPGSFVGPTSCTTSGGTGSCTAVITSNNAGTTVVRAATDVTVGGESLHRETGDSNFGDSGDAQKKWTGCVTTPGQTATFTTTSVTVNGVPAYKLTYTQPLSANDNAYSTTSPTVFWNGKQHKFQDLVGSDQAEFVITNGSTTLFDFNLDYIDKKSGTPSGYGSLGPFGGDGKFTTGDQSAILGWTTTLDDNLNQTGYCSGGNCTSGGVNLLTDSPPPVSTSDESQGAAPPFGQWNFINGYTVIIKASALPAGFSNSNWTVPFVHNSPAKSTVTTPCPPDANIQIAPATAQNPTGTNHTVTAHVNVNDGSGNGFSNAPNNTQIQFSIVSGPGSFVGPNNCNTVGTTGSCTVVITSTTTGTTVIRAATDVKAGSGGGAPTLHRQTGDSNLGDSPDAQKVWVPCQTGANSPTFTTTLTTFNGVSAYKLEYDQPLSLNDNSYSTSNPTAFWGQSQHKFQDLTGSDKAEFLIKDGSTTLFDFAIDYISAKSGTPSGYASLGPFGGDGQFSTGDQSAILGWTTSLDDDLNATGYCTAGNCTTGSVNLLTDSPPPVSLSDETQGAAAPFTKWNYVDSYTVYIKATALPAGFSNSNWSIPLAHNSPAKSQSQTCS